MSQIVSVSLIGLYEGPLVRELYNDGFYFRLSPEQSGETSFRNAGKNCENRKCSKHWSKRTSKNLEDGPLKTVLEIED